MKKTYLVNKRNIVEYRTNQKEYIFANSKLNKAGFPLYWPTRNESNQQVFISFVDAQIFDLNGQPIDEEIGNFDILDSETFDPKAENAKTKVKFISALLSPKYQVRGGVYFKGEFYTGQMKKPLALKLYQAFMSKYFYVQDREFIENSFDKDENGFFPFWPIKSRDADAIIFSAVNAAVYEKESGKPVLENVNFNLVKGLLFDLKNKEHAVMADTILALLNSNYTVRGFYYKGKLIPDVLSQKMKLYLEKGFIKKNFAIEDADYLKEYVTLSEKGELVFMPMQDKKRRPIVVSFRNGNTPLGEQYQNFDIYSDVVFDPRDKTNQDYLRIIEGIINKEKDFSGSLYLDGVLLPNKEKVFEIERRKNKVEKALKVRIDGNPDYLRIFNTFNTDDREKLLLIAPCSRTVYPFLGKVPKKKDELVKNKTFLVFDNVNIINEKGDFLFKEHYNATYEKKEGVQLNEQERQIMIELFRVNSMVRGGIYFNGRNINRRRNIFTTIINKMKVSKLLDAEGRKEMQKAAKTNACPYDIERRSKMPEHWPVFDKNGKEVLLSVVDADVWFKVSRTTVKAANNMNINIYSGETFGLVGESGSGKTTISRAILGINKLRKGGIYWKGSLISSGLNKRQAKMIKKSIQMIFQDPAASLNERANIDYIVSEGLYNFHLFKNREERLTKVTSMLREVGLLPEHLSRYPHEFSGGQRQRIGIARALVIEPELVLADEPISALDVSIRAQVLNLLRKLQKEQDLTYLFIAHDLSIIRYISDRIAVMHNGFIVEAGLAEDIYSNPLHPYTKSLLTAIPQPDPKSKNDRVRITYDQGNIIYEDCFWKEFLPGHYVLVNDELEESIKASIK